jgi:hypothetical protein
MSQESLCATFGAGLSSACVVDIGAERTSVACVDDGLLLGETRYVAPRSEARLWLTAEQTPTPLRAGRRDDILHRPPAPRVVPVPRARPESSPRLADDGRVDDADVYAS